MKKIAVLFFIAISILSCEFQPESQKQKYYTPTASQITDKLFTEKGTSWGISFYEYYSIETKTNKYKYSKKGSGFRYSFSKNFHYEYQRWRNDYEYVWYPVIEKSYSGVVDVSNGKLIFHDLLGETRVEESIQFSENGEWIKIGDPAYKRNN